VFPTQDNAFILTLT